MAQFRHWETSDIYRTRRNHVFYEEIVAERKLAEKEKVPRLLPLLDPICRCMATTVNVSCSAYLFVFAHMDLV